MSERHEDEARVPKSKAIDSALEEIEGLQEAISGGKVVYPSDLEGVRQKLEAAVNE